MQRELIPQRDAETGWVGVILPFTQEFFLILKIIYGDI